MCWLKFEEFCIFIVDVNIIIVVICMIFLLDIILIVINGKCIFYFNDVDIRFNYR